MPETEIQRQRRERSHPHPLLLDSTDVLATLTKSYLLYAVQAAMLAVQGQEDRGYIINWQSVREDLEAAFWFATGVKQ